MILRTSLFILMPLSIILSFLWAPAADILGESSRILYFHVPIAWVSVLAFLSSGLCSILYLRDRNSPNDTLEITFHNSAVIGMVFSVLTVITGSIWAHHMWGSYWNWDPRETSIVLLLLVYMAYLSLRSTVAEHPGRGRISASYLIFAMVTVPFFVFIIPRIYPSLHPDPVINAERKIHLDLEMRITLMISLISFTLLYFYLLKTANRLSRLLIIKKVVGNEK